MSYNLILFKIRNIIQNNRELQYQIIQNNNLKENLEKELQHYCEHKFIRESNNDYHKPSYYNICSECQLVEKK